MREYSDLYKEERDAPIREATDITIMISTEVSSLEKPVYLVGSPCAYFCNMTNVFSWGGEDDYATLYEDYIDVGGNLVFAPEEGGEKKGGYISEEVSDMYHFAIRTDNENVAVYRLGVHFSMNAYPQYIHIYDDNNTYYNTSNNTEYDVFVDDEIPDITKLRFEFGDMNISGRRLNIISIQLGDIIYFDSDDVIDCTFSEQFSPICAFLPQHDFTVNIDNTDQRFTYESVKVIRQKQWLSYFYRQYLPSENDYGNQSEQIFFMPTLQISSVNLSKEKLTIKAVDYLRYDNKINYEGRWNNIPMTAADVLKYYHGSEKHFDLTSHIDTLPTTAMFPPVPNKEILQLIANSVGGYLTVDGQAIELHSNKIQEGFIKFLSNTYNVTPFGYKLAANAPFRGGDKDYADLGNDSIIVGTPMLFYPEDDSPEIAFWSSVLSDEDGDFEELPSVHYSIPTGKAITKLHIVWGGNTWGKSVQVRYYKDKNRIYSDTYYRLNNKKENTIDLEDYGYTYDEVGIYFLSTDYSYQRISLWRLYFSVKTETINPAYDFVLDENNSFGLNKLSQEEAIQSIEVDYGDYIYDQTEEVQELVNEKISSGDFEYHFEYPLKVQEFSINGIKQPITDAIYKVSGNAPVDNSSIVIKGNSLTKVDQKEMIKVNDDGENIVWNNPLIKTKKMADFVGEILKDYYKNNIEYQIEERGYPELECGDKFFVRDSLDNNLYEVQLVERTLRYNGALRETVRVRRTTHE